MSRVIFDIETLGSDFDELDETTQEYLLRRAETEEQREDIKDSLSLYPQTAEIISIGMYNPDTSQGVVYYQSRGSSLSSFEEEGIRFEDADEAGILRYFWDVINRYDEFVTFNGRGFDCPFILIRSAIHKMKPTRDLMPYRYKGPHIDLFDQLSFFGAVRRKFSLDMWCRTFGIKSPKDDGVKGEDVRQLFTEGRYLDIARYCARDIKATAELLHYWETYIRFS